MKAICWIRKACISYLCSGSETPKGIDPISLFAIIYPIFLIYNPTKLYRPRIITGSTST